MGLYFRTEWFCQTGRCFRDADVPVTRSEFNYHLSSSFFAVLLACSFSFLQRSPTFQERNIYRMLQYIVMRVSGLKIITSRAAPRDGSLLIYCQIDTLSHHSTARSNAQRKPTYGYLTQGTNAIKLYGKASN